MAYDKQPPRNRTIFITGVLSLFLLGALVPVFRYYFAEQMLGAAEEDSRRLAEQREQDDSIETVQEQRERLAQATLSIEDAMARLATGNRAGTSVAPRSTDHYELGEEAALASLDAIKGWASRERTREYDAALAELTRARSEETNRRNLAAATAQRAALEEAKEPIPPELEARIARLQRQVRSDAEYNGDAPPRFAESAGAGDGTMGDVPRVVIPRLELGAPPQ